jgi:transcriptional regulator of arginine metabolism
MVKRRNNRQDAIRDIVRGKSIRTQRALVDELQAIGFNCTQATVSRDIADMGLRKLSEGIYVLAEDLHLQRMVSEFVNSVDRVDNFVVIKSQPGTAPGVAAAVDAAAVDAAALPEVIGSVAGNDTVLVVAASSEASDDLVNLINKLRDAQK